MQKYYILQKVFLWTKSKDMPDMDMLILNKLYSVDYNYYNLVEVKLSTLVEGDPKAPFSLVTYLILLSVKQGGVKYHFKSLLKSLEPRSPGPLANTLPTRPMSRCSFA